MNLSDKEKKLISDLLIMASIEFCNHGCSDLDPDIWKGWTLKERRALIAEYHHSNGEPEEAKEGHSHIEDWVLMRHMAKKIIQ